MTVISADWCGPQRTDSLLCRPLHPTHTQPHTRCAQDDVGIFNQAQNITCNEAVCLVGSLGAYILPNAKVLEPIPIEPVTAL